MYETPSESFSPNRVRTANEPEVRLPNTKPTFPPKRTLSNRRKLKTSNTLAVTAFKNCHLVNLSVVLAGLLLIEIRGVPII